MDRKAIVRKLRKWFARNARDLPWRKTRDPYTIWVSEVMLQQTQVQTVIPYWERWIRELPTLRALAKAKPETIHKLWEGLGYYTRVRNLQQAARQIVAQHAGKLPPDREALLALPGVGRYTAGAICSIAFNQPEPILDGNVIRVLARVFGIDGDVRKAAVRAQFWALAEELVKYAAIARPQPRCSQLNQALMELGAIVCTPRQPRCEACPIKKDCVARRHNCIDLLPRAAPRPSVTKRRFLAFVVERRGRFLVRQRPAGVVNAHLWEFPNVEVSMTEDNPGRAARALFSNPIRIGESLAEVAHSITRYRVTLKAYRVTPENGLFLEDGVWADRRRLRTLTFCSAHKKLLQTALAAPKLRNEVHPAGKHSR